MDEVPRVRLSAAIFRRGGEKKELFGQTHEEDVSDEVVLAGKVANWEAVWSAPRIGCGLRAPSRHRSLHPRACCSWADEPAGLALHLGEGSGH
jgi:hypothetical protein